VPPARSKARKRALDVLFEAELRGLPVLDLLAERITMGSPPVSPYAADLVRGVTVHRARIDELMGEYAEGWTLDRMPAVDRNVLRIGLYELLWADDVPDGVAISEAVLLARDLSTDASPAFINGLLARIADLKPSLTLDSAGPGSEPAPEPGSPRASEPAGQREPAPVPGTSEPPPGLEALPEPGRGCAGEPAPVPPASSEP
jgi:transcription antitermination protein NusB